MLLYPIFLVATLVALVLLGFTKFEEDAPKGKSTTFFQCLGMLGNATILLFFLGIICHVGIDVGINTCAPKIIMEKLGLPLAKAGIATSVYFLFRMVGCLTGSFILAHFPLKKFFAISVAMMALSMIGLMVFKTLVLLYIAIALVGYGNSNIFSMIFSSALLSNQDKSNEISGIMIMGLIGGSIFPLFMGILSDALGSQVGSVIIISVGVLYLAYLSFKLFSMQKS